MTDRPTAPAQSTAQTDATKEEKEPFFTYVDARQIAMVAVCWLGVRLLPERRWPWLLSLIGRAAIRLNAEAGRQGAKLIGRLFVDGLPNGEAPEALPERIATRMVEEPLLWCQLARRPDWRPAMRLEGAEAVDALIGKAGVMLWIAPQPVGMLLSAIAGHDRGWPLHRLSREGHGLSSSRFGDRYLNPPVQRLENRFAERIIIGAGGSAPAVAAMRAALRASEVVQVHAVAEAHRLDDFPFLGGTMRLALGSPKLAVSEDAAVIGVSVEREADGAFRLRYATLRTPGEEVALTEIGQRMAEHLAAALSRDPAQARLVPSQFPMPQRPA
ncbi:MAG: hypothetical protein AAGG47_21035 [Pseudomonadota bacterium]